MGVSPRMGRMPDLHILRVFTAEDGSGGNVLGVFLAGAVPTRIENGQVLVAGRPEWTPRFRWFELGSPAEVEALTGAPEGHELAAAYAWNGEGEVRARVFPVSLGIAEDEATGAAAVR